MTMLQQTVRTARLLIEEAEATARIRHAYVSILVKNAQFLFSTIEDKIAKKNLQVALKDKDTDPSMLYRGLLVQLNGIFENFIRSLCAAILKQKSLCVGSYKDLDVSIQREHTYRSAMILSKIKENSIYGNSYDFESLQNSWAKCVLNHKDYEIQPDVFTLLMGNCTSDRLTNLFRSLSMSDPFDDLLGRHSELRACTNERSHRRVAKFAKSSLDVHIALRNDIAHGNLTRAVTKDEFESCSKFYKALIEALSDKVSNELGAQPE